jgi:hypothetical protein
MLDNRTCVNEECREFGVERDVEVGEWFPDDPLLCPLCGELMGTTVPVAAVPVWSPVWSGWFPGGGWRGPRWPRRW